MSGQDEELDPDAPATEEELASLSRPGGDLGAHAELVSALRAAHAPADLPPAEHERLVAAALARVPSKRAGRVRAAVSVGAALALAAGVVLLLRTATSDSPFSSDLASRTKPDLLRARSTQPLFDEPFARDVVASVRIDRIALARGEDFRENRFARWGIR